jgi:hypothetical protein
MKRLSAVAIVLIASSATAGVRIETIRRDMKTLVASGNSQVVLVQDGKVKFAGSPKGAMVLKEDTLYIIDDEHQNYRTMTREQMEKMATQASAAISKVQEKMKNMSPEQRAQMEKLMGKLPGAQSGMKPADYEAKDTGKSDTSDGRKCRLWNILKNGVPHEELCVVPFSTLPGKEDMQKTFKQLAESFQGMAPGKKDNSVAAHSAVDGYPVRVRNFEKDGTFAANEMVLKSWTEVTVPSSTFEVPAGYRKQELPTFGKP